MGAATYTEAEERRYQLPPLPYVPSIPLEESLLRNGLYEEARRRYRLMHPIIDLKGGA